jgi:hypothetical protein
VSKLRELTKTGTPRVFATVAVDQDVTHRPTWRT